MSVGHPNAQRERTMESREKAWYMLLFQFEGVAEELLMRDDWALFREWTRGDGDTEQAIERLSRPGRADRGAELVPRLDCTRASSSSGATPSRPCACRCSGCGARATTT